MKFYIQTYNQRSLISAPKIHTDLLWDLTFLFIGLAVVYFFFVFFYRNRLTARAERERNRKKELSPMISEFLFYDDEASKDEKSNYVNLKIEIRQLLKDDFNRKVLSEVLLDLRKDVAGDTQKELFKLYQDLGLHNDAFEKLKSWKWELVSKAILDLTQMQVGEAYSFVTKFINDKRSTIRKQAEIAVVTLRPEGINYFLDTTKYKISEWQQLKLLDVLRNRETYQPPRFKAWLTSTNRYVVLFALRLIKFYNQNDASAALIELVKHKNDQIKEEAIACIKEFHIVEAIEMLKLVFWKSSTDIKISILGAIGELGSEKDIEFLQLIEKKESNFSVKSKAFSSINTIAPDSIMPSKGLLSTTGYEIPPDIMNHDKEETNLPKAKETPVFEKEHNTINLNVNDMNEGESIIKNMEVDYEELSTDRSASRIKSFDNNIDELLEPKDEKVELEMELSIDFLPIVVDHDNKSENDDSHKTVDDKNIFEITVAYEEVLPKNANNSKSKEYKEYLNRLPKVEISDEEIAFLPVVIENEMVLAKNDTCSSSTVNPNVLALEVLFEIITVGSKKSNMTNISSNSVAVENSMTTLDYSRYQKEEILNIAVISEEVTTLTNKAFNDKSNRQSEPYPLPFSMDSYKEDSIDVTSIETTEYTKPQEIMDHQDKEKFKKILKNLIDLSGDEQRDEMIEKLKDGPLLEFGNEFIEISATEQKAEEQIDKIEVEEPKENEIQKIDENPSSVEHAVPMAILTDDMLEEIVLFKENTEESRMQLLDDLAEMGDHRELPLLNELLVNEKYRTVKDRIQKLIETFSQDEVKSPPEILFKPFNVFEDLFRTCDTEAKLILMDEIIAVGDEGEITFLESLIEKEEGVVKQKAIHILKALSAKLGLHEEKEEVKTYAASNAKVQVPADDKTTEEYDSLMKELEIEAPIEDDLFELDFELSEPLAKNETDNTKDDISRNQSTLIGQICSFSHKIIDRFNG